MSDQGQGSASERMHIEAERGRGDAAGPALTGGKLLAEITNRIVAMMREHYGRGPIKAKTYVLDNLIVCGPERWLHRDRAHDDGGRSTRSGVGDAPGFPTDDESPL